jgi:hypothetical protein
MLLELVVLLLCHGNAYVKLTVAHTREWGAVRSELTQPVIHVNVERVDQLGLGLKFICDSDNAPVIVSEVTDEGAISSNGWLRSGDQLLSIDLVDVSSTNQGLVFLFRTSVKMSSLMHLNI